VSVKDRVIRPQQTVCLIATLKRRRKTKELITLHFKTNGYISLSTARSWLTKADIIIIIVEDFAVIQSSSAIFFDHSSRFFIFCWSSSIVAQQESRSSCCKCPCVKCTQHSRLENESSGTKVSLQLFKALVDVRGAPLPQCYRRHYGSVTFFTN